MKYSDAQSAIFIERIWSWFHLQPIPHGVEINSLSRADTKPRVVINFRSDDAPRTSRDTDFILAGSDQSVFVNPNTLRFTTNQSTLIVSDNEGQTTIDVWLNPVPSLEVSHPDAWVMCNRALEIALRRLGVFTVHAAAVIEPVSRHTAIIVGESGSGKTTLVTQLARQGWQYVDDDTVLLKAVAESRFAHAEASGVCALRRYFALTDNSLLKCDLLSAVETQTTVRSLDDTKVLMRTAKLFPHRQVLQAVPTHIIFTTIANQSTSRMTALGATEAMSRLIGLCSWSRIEVAPIARAYLAALTRLVKQCRAAQLQAGRDVLIDNGTGAAAVLQHYLQS